MFNILPFVFAFTFLYKFINYSHIETPLVEREYSNKLQIFFDLSYYLSIMLYVVWLIYWYFIGGEYASALLGLGVGALLGNWVGYNFKIIHYYNKFILFVHIYVMITLGVFQ